MREVEFDENGKRISIPTTCFDCKDRIVLKRYEKNDVIYFDKRFYHKQCFINMNSLKKKCACCGEDIIINSVNQPIIYYDKRYYHLDCFDSECELKKNKSKKWKTAFLNRDKYIDAAKEKISDLFAKRKANLNNLHKYEEETERQIQYIWDESDVNSFLKETYSVHTLGNFYSRYLRPVYNGEFHKAPGTVIPPADLLYMWQKKMPYLISGRAKKIKSGVEMTVYQKMAYDLAVLINKYDSYLEWKKSQRVLEIESINIQKNILKDVDLQKIGERTSKAKNGCGEDIDTLLEEMF